MQELSIVDIEEVSGGNPVLIALAIAAMLYASDAQ